MFKKIKLVFIIPTIGRYSGINALLGSIENQNPKPDLIIIVDSNKEYSENKFKKYSFPIKYVHTGPNSLTEARNIGIKNVSDDIELVGFLDDDTVLCNDAMDNMYSFWRSTSENAGGASFNIINFPPLKVMALKKLFFLDSTEKGRLLKSGFGTSLYPVTADRKVQWLSGGNTIWRKEVFDKFKFDENLKGYGFVDDLDFSYRVGKHYELFVVVKANMKHFTCPIDKKKLFHFGLREVTSRYYFLCKHKEFSIILFYWAYLGLIITDIISDIRNLRCHYSKRSFGNMIGVFYTLVFKGKSLNIVV